MTFQTNVRINYKLNSPPPAVASGMTTYATWAELPEPTGSGDYGIVANVLVQDLATQGQWGPPIFTAEAPLAWYLPETVMESGARAADGGTPDAWNDASGNGKHMVESGAGIDFGVTNGVLSMDTSTTAMSMKFAGVLGLSGQSSAVCNTVIRPDTSVLACPFVVIDVADNYAGRLLPLTGSTSRIYGRNTSGGASISETGTIASANWACTEYRIDLDKAMYYISSFDLGVNAVDNEFTVGRPLAKAATVGGSTFVGDETGLWLGRRGHGSLSFNGQVAEYIFSGDQSAEYQSQVLAYLNIKYKSAT